MQHEISSEAFDFIRDEVAHGGALAKRLVSIPREGKVVAILPVDAAHADLVDFESGGIATGDEAHELADIVRAHISFGASHICVFEHVSRVGDPWKPPVDYFTVGEHVFLFLSEVSDHDAIADSSRHAHSYPSIGVISSLPIGQPIPQPGSAQPETLLDHIAGHVNAILVGAYDAESWLVWFPAARSDPSSK
jgi:hypothetical protein